MYVSSLLLSSENMCGTSLSIGVLEFTLVLPKSSSQTECDIRSIFKEDFNKFEFRVFLLLDRLPYQG